MEHFLPLPRESTLSGPFSPIDTLGFPSSWLLREPGLCSLPAHPHPPSVSTYFSGCFLLFPSPFLSFAPATPSLQPSIHPLLNFHHRFLTAPPPSKPPISNPFSLCSHSHLSRLQVCVPPPTLTQKAGKSLPLNLKILASLEDLKGLL